MKSRIKTVGEIIGTGAKVERAVGTIRTIRVDAEKVEQAIGSAAKPFLDFLEALAEVVAPQPEPEPSSAKPDEEETG